MGSGRRVGVARLECEVRAGLDGTLEAVREAEPRER